MDHFHVGFHHNIQQQIILSWFCLYKINLFPLTLYALLLILFFDYFYTGLSRNSIAWYKNKFSLYTLAIRKHLNKYQLYTFCLSVYIRKELLRVKVLLPYAS